MLRLFSVSLSSPTWSFCVSLKILSTLITYHFNEFMYTSSAPNDSFPLSSISRPQLAILLNSFMLQAPLPHKHSYATSPTDLEKLSTARFLSKSHVVSFSLLEILADVVPFRKPSPFYESQHAIRISSPRTSGS